MYENTGDSAVKTLVENPSGIGIMEQRYGANIPFVMISQGYRHEGDFETVRTALDKHPIASKNGMNPVYHFFADSGNRIDKSQSKAWRLALDGTDTNSKIFRDLLSQIEK